MEKGERKESQKSILDGEQVLEIEERGVKQLSTTPDVESIQKPGLPRSS